MSNRWLPALCAGLLWASQAPAQGVLVPSDPSVAPLRLVSHEVDVRIDEQVSVTRVTQVFRNDGGRDLEATYVFPVPKGADVNKFSMWVNGKEEKAELVESDKARQIYTDIVRRAQDPGLLEYVGSNLLKVRVYPVPAHGEQKLTFSFTALVSRDSGLCEYTYPLRTAEPAARALNKFSLHVHVKAKDGLTNVYSPTHKVSVKKNDDHDCDVTFVNENAALDRDFTLYYTPTGKDVGLTAVPFHAGDGDGYVLLLIAPRAELAKAEHVPQNFVFVLDTSGSMNGPKMEQARKALKFCLNGLAPGDRFNVMNFASTVNPYHTGLIDYSPGHVEAARKWVDGLEAVGGTAIDAALETAQKMRPADSDRTFTVVFFTDGEPTVGETNPDTIVKNALARSSANTRIFTFGVGDDVNAAMLDRLADQTRAVSTYVRPQEDIEVKVSGMYAKISHPVLTDLKLTASGNVTLTEMYPPRLPDLFHGGQVVALARYKGHGHTALTLSGHMGGDNKEVILEVALPKKTGTEKAFVEGLWARRKVGYLLDEIRSHGENKELVDEVVKLAKKHGIATPYTSYLLVPDAAPTPPRPTVQAVPVVPPKTAPGAVPYAQSRPVAQTAAPASGYAPHGYQINGAGAGGMVPPGVTTTGTINQSAQPGFTFNQPQMQWAPQAPARVPTPVTAAPAPSAAAPQVNYDATFWSEAPARAPQGGAAAPAPPPATAQTGKEGVDLAVLLNALRSEEQAGAALTRQAGGRTCVRLGGVWTDQGFNKDMKTVRVKALSDAYFRLLAKRPELKEVFQMGNRVVWVTPSGVALVVADDGADKLADEEIAKLFVVK
jgi:Ca-activated chloride channel family protein